MSPDPRARPLDPSPPSADPPFSASAGDAVPTRSVAPADDGLRAALRSLPMHDEAPRLAALQRRVLDDWRAAHAMARPAWRGLGVGGGLRGPAVRRHRPSWVLPSMVLLGALLAVASLWPHRFAPAHDPVLEELMQPDVLSQMAVGEM